MTWKVGMLGAVILTALAGASFFTKQHDVSFKRLQEAHTRLTKLGYYCTSDSANGKIGCGFLISRKAVMWNDVSTMCKSGPMGPEWEGKVWVTLNPDIWQLQGVPEQAGVRVWGAVVAFGDDKLLHEIEDLL
jgi:hypothetical protein